MVFLNWENQNFFYLVLKSHFANFISKGFVKIIIFLIEWALKFVRNLLSTKIVSLQL